MKPATLPACLLLILTGCNDNGDQVQPSQNIHLITITDGLNHPWSLAFLPDGSMLVTERSGAMRRISADDKVGCWM